MKTTKLVVGIISIVLTIVVLFQSCAASLGDAMQNQGGTSGGAGMIVAILMLIAGIVAIAARSSRGGGIFCLILYFFAGLVGITSSGIYKDLIIWGVLCFLFAAIFLFATIKTPKQKKGNKSNEA